MNSTKLSLKEGFDFLFEEDQKKEKKFRINLGKKEDIQQSSNIDHLAIILATDIVSSRLQDKSEPTLLSLALQSSSGDGQLSTGKMLNLQKVFNTTKTLSQFQDVMGFSDDKISNAQASKDVFNMFKTAVEALKNAGAGNIMLEQENTERNIKLSKARYRIMFDKMGRGARFFPTTKSGVNIYFGRLYTSIKSGLNNGKLLKTDLSQDIKDIENFEDLSQNEKAYIATIDVLKKPEFKAGKYTTKRNLKAFLEKLQNNENLSSSIEEFIEGLKKGISKANKKAWVDFFKDLENVDSKEELAGVEEELFKALDTKFGDESDSEEPPEIKETKGLEERLQELSKDFESLKGKVTSDTNNLVQYQNSIDSLFIDIEIITALLNETDEESLKSKANSLFQNITEFYDQYNIEVTIDDKELAQAVKQATVSYEDFDKTQAPNYFDSPSAKTFAASLKGNTEVGLPEPEMKGNEVTLQFGDTDQPQEEQEDQTPSSTGFRDVSDVTKLIDENDKFEETLRKADRYIIDVSNKNITSAFVYEGKSYDFTIETVYVDLEYGNLHNFLTFGVYMPDFDLKKDDNNTLKTDLYNYFTSIYKPYCYELRDEKFINYHNFPTNNGEGFANLLDKIVESENKKNAESEQQGTQAVTEMLTQEAGLSQDDAEQKVPELVQVLKAPDEQEKAIEEKRQEITINSVDNLLDDKVIRDMSDKIYKDDSLVNFISQISEDELQTLKIVRNQGQIDNFKLRVISDLNPNIDALKPMIRDIFEGELQPVFDSLFMRKEFDEPKFRAAYGAMIVSAFDKLIDPKEGRVTENFFRNIKRAVTAGAANILKLTPILVPVLAVCTGIMALGGAAIMATIVATFSTWTLFSSLKDIAKFEEAKRAYQDNPLKYIEDTLFKDKSSRKVIKTLVNGAAADVIMKRINAEHAVNSYRKDLNIAGGLSKYSQKIEQQVSVFKDMSGDEKRKVKLLNDNVLNELSKTPYYAEGIVSESMINMIFNEVMFGENKISDDVRGRLLKGEIKPENKEDLKAIVLSLRSAVKGSSIKNNLIDFVEKEVRQASKLFSKENKRFSAADDAELKDKEVVGGKGLAALGDNKVFGMHAQYFISPEQINEEFIDKLLTKIIGKNREEYYKQGDVETNFFKEAFTTRSLTSLLFEADISDFEAGQIKQQKNREEANKGKEDHLPGIGALGTANWVQSLYQTILFKKSYMEGGLPIFKDIVAKIPGTASKILYKFSANPKAALVDNQLGFDMGHKLIEYTNPYTQKVEQMYFYFYSSSKYAGTPEALSAQIVDPATGVAKEIGHGKYLFKWFAENADWAKKAGISIDKKNGVASILKGVKGVSELDANSPQMSKALNIIQTHLEGTYKSEVLEAVSNIRGWTLSNELNMIDYAGGDVNEFGQYFLKDLLLKAGVPNTAKIDNDLYEGVTKSIFRKLVKISETGDSAQEKAANLEAVQTKLAEFFEQGRQIKAKADVLKQFMDKGIDEITTENMTKLADVSNEYGELVEKTLKYFSSAYTKVDVKKLFVKAVGEVAQQGHDPMLDFDIIPGEPGFVTTTRTVKGFTDKDILVELPTDEFWGPFMKAVSGKLGKFAIGAKILAKFYTRGIKGGEFAKQFTNMFSLKDQVQLDIMKTLLGQKIESKSSAIGQDGGMTPSNHDPFQSLKQPQTYAGGQITNLDNDALNTLSPQQENIQDGFVYKVSLKDYLFENNIVKETSRSVGKASKESDLQKELNEHRNLQKMFKNMF